MSVLVIDDDQDIREFFQDFLGGEGFEVATLADPTAAVGRLRDQVFHLIVLDLMMPKLAGLDLLPQIRAIDDDIPVIIMTGSPWLGGVAASSLYADSGGSGVSAYFEHPIRPAEFREAIARIAKDKGFV